MSSFEVMFRGMKWKRIREFFFKRVTRNVIFWLLFTLFHYSGRGNLYYLYPILFFVLIVSYAGPCYFNNLILIPKLLERRRYLVYTGSFIILLAVTSIISYYITVWSNKTFPELNYMGNLKDVALPYHAFPSLLMFVMFASAKFTTDAFQNQHKLELLETQRLSGELESLKSQINPHFLFNSLNTIYGLAKRTDDDTAESILILSDILRYVLYDCNTPLISLEKEIAFINHYIEFAKLRRNKVDIQIHAEINAAQLKIAPLILLPFIENAIKHGLDKHIDDAWVHINICLDKNSFYFECSNSNRNKSNTTNLIGASSGIGLKNVKRRLNLLYQNKHKLVNESINDVYTVRLNLELS